MERILIIEDERGIRDSLKEILELSGYDVQTARNGKEGYELILIFQPRLVLCDVRMPEMDGFELLEVINEQMKKNAPTFIFITAQVEKNARIQGEKLGAVAYINKPFDHLELLKVIDDQVKVLDPVKGAHVYYALDYKRTFEDFSLN